MEILKQHYEKVVLGVLVLGFIFSLIYLLQMVESARDVTLDNLKLGQSRTKYESADFKQQSFSFEHLLYDRVQLPKRAVPAKGLQFTAGLVVPMESFRCEHHEDNCPLIMPKALVDNKEGEARKCCFCGRILSKPEEDPYLSGVGGDDTDKDGMPDIYEERMGFNPYDAKDALEDTDSDGFYNLYEYISNTNPRDAKSFPPVEKRLYLQRLVPTKLPIKLDGVTKLNDPKNPWEIMLEIEGYASSYSLNQEVEFRKNKYKITKVEYRKGDQQSSSVVLDKDRSRVTLTLADPKAKGAKTIVLTAGEVTYDSNPDAMIADIKEDIVRLNNRKRKNKRFVRIKVGGVLSLGVDGKNAADFQLISTDANSKTATLLKLDDNKQVLLKVFEVPEAARAQAKNDDSDNDGDARPQRRPRRRSRRN